MRLKHLKVGQNLHANMEGFCRAIHIYKYCYNIRKVKFRDDFSKYIWLPCNTDMRPDLNNMHGSSLTHPVLGIWRSITTTGNSIQLWNFQEWYKNSNSTIHESFTIIWHFKEILWVTKVEKLDVWTMHAFANLVIYHVIVTWNIGSYSSGMLDYSYSFASIMNFVTMI